MDDQSHKYKNVEEAAEQEYKLLSRIPVFFLTEAETSHIYHTLFGPKILCKSSL